MNDITVLIPISPIPSHPEGSILGETIGSIRERLPDSEIILMFDGVNTKLLHLKADYEEYIRRTLWDINFKMKNVTPLVFKEHKHQSLMVKEALKIVKTPIMLWSEQDTPLTGEIPFAELAEIIKSGESNAIRLHHEAQVHPEHKYLMLDKEPVEVMGQPLLRCTQWSGRPHLASTSFYQVLVDEFMDDKPRFIEHIMYGPIASRPDLYDNYRLHMYAPEGTLVRSLHLDGRRFNASHYDPSAS